MGLFGNLFKRNLNILVVGKDSMLGHDLFEHLATMSSFTDSGIGTVIGVSHEEFDITDEHSMFTYLSRDRNMRFDYVVNCSAITDTTGCEGKLRDESYAVNSLGCLYLARICRMFGPKLIHISTDYVFSEKSERSILAVTDPFPVNTYGTHKLLGEKFIECEMKPSRYAILRTSWLYGNHRHKSFVHKFLSNLEKNRGNLSCPDDQISIPTSTNELVHMVTNCIRYDIHGTLSACGLSRNGSGISRLDFARQIVLVLRNIGLLDEDVVVNQCKTDNSGCMKYPLHSHLPSCNDRQVDERLRDGLVNKWDEELYSFISRNFNDINETYRIRKAT